VRDSFAGGYLVRSAREETALARRAVSPRRPGWGPDDLPKGAGAMNLANPIVTRRTTPTHNALDRHSRLRKGCRHRNRHAPPAPKRGLLGSLKLESKMFPGDSCSRAWIQIVLRSNRA